MTWRVKLIIVVFNFIALDQWIIENCIRIFLEVNTKGICDLSNSRFHIQVRIRFCSQRVFCASTRKKFNRTLSKTWTSTIKKNYREIICSASKKFDWLNFLRIPFTIRELLFPRILFKTANSIATNRLKSYAAIDAFNCFTCPKSYGGIRIWYYLESVAS